MQEWIDRLSEMSPDDMVRYAAPVIGTLCLIVAARSSWWALKWTVSLFHHKPTELEALVLAALESPQAVYGTETVGGYTYYVVTEGAMKAQTGGDGCYTYVYVNGACLSNLHGSVKKAVQSAILSRRDRLAMDTLKSQATKGA